MKALWATLVPLMLVGLSGCATPSSNKGPASLVDEQAFEGIDVQATSTTGVIRGVVVDEAIRPLAGAVVRLIGVEESQTSNAKGAFGFDGLPAGNYFLVASTPTYTSVQQAVQVVAGVDDPDVVRILLTAEQRLAPYVEAVARDLFVSAGACLDGACTALSAGIVTGVASPRMDAYVSPNGTVLQAEFNWKPTTAYSDVLHVWGGAFIEATGEYVEYGVYDGPSPLVVRAEASNQNGTSDFITYGVKGATSSSLPGNGIMLNQEIRGFLHVFHNFVPREDWQFGRDGEYPVPD